MKKNTLLIQSLLLPLIVSTTTFGMDTAQPQTEQTASDSTLDTTTLFYGQDGQVTPELPVNDEINQSVIHQDKGLGIFGRIQYWVSNNKSTAISYLQNGTFDVTNGSHHTILKDALNEAVATEDAHTIATIAALCQSTEKYKKHIHISDEVARPCVGILDKKFTEQKNAADEVVQKAHQNSIAAYEVETLAFTQALGELVRAYRLNRTTIAAAYDTTVTEVQQKLENTRSRFSTFAHINRNQNIQEEVRGLLKSGIVAPQNQIADLAAASERIMSAIGNKSDKLPKIATPANLLIDNK